MPEVDASIPLRAVTPNADPLATMGKYQALQQGLLQNRLLGQAVGSKLSMGKAFGSAIGPNGFDPALVPQYYAQHPNESQYAPEAIAAGQTQANAQLDQQIKDLQQHRESLGLSADQGKFLSAAMLPAIQKFSAVDPKTGQPAAIPTSDDLRNAYVNAFTAMGPGATTTALQRAQKSVADAGDDPAKIIEAMKGAALIGNPTPETLNMLVGPVTQTAAGNRIAITQTSPLGGPVTERGDIKLGLSPGESAALVDWTDPTTGKVYKVPRGALADQAGGAAGAPAAPASGARNGRYPGAANPLGAGAPPGAVAPGALAPGTPELMAKSAETYIADQTAVPNIRRSLTGFDQAYDALKIAKTGPGSETLQNLRGVADTYGVPLPVLGNKSQTEAYAEVNKWLSSVLASEAQRLGLGTDQGRALQGEAQPGVHTVHGAAVAMLPILKGLKAMEVVAPMIAKKEGWTPQQYVEKRAAWANTVDPLAFGFDLMPADQRKAIIAKAKTSDQKARLANGLRAAQEAGLFQISDLPR